MRVCEERKKEGIYSLNIFRVQKYLQGISWEIFALEVFSKQYSRLVSLLRERLALPYRLLLRSEISCQFVDLFELCKKIEGILQVYILSSYVALVLV